MLLWEQLTRRSIVTINRCRADHYNLAASLHRVNMIADPKCDCGNDLQDLNHVLLNCSKYYSQRKQIISKFGEHNHFPPFTVKSFLATLDLRLIEIICEFFEKSELIIQQCNALLYAQLSH